MNWKFLEKMNWKFLESLKFWDSKSAGFIPSVPEKLASHSNLSRGSMMVLFGAMGVSAIGAMIYLSFIGIDNIQVSDSVKIAEKVSTAIFASFGAASAIFWGVVAGSKGKLWLRILAASLAFTCGTLEVVSTFKGRSSNITVQDSVRAKAELDIKAKDDQINDVKKLIETLQGQATPKADVALNTKSSYLRLEAERQNAERRKSEGQSTNALKEAIEKKDKLLEERKALPNPPPTESSILGSDNANMLRLISSVCLWLVSIVSFRYFGEVMASFSVHKTNKFVPENTRAEAIKRREEAVNLSPLEKYRNHIPMTPQEAATAEALGAGRFAYDVNQQIPPPPAPPKRQLQQAANDAPPPPVAPAPIDLSDAARDLTNAALTGLTVATAFPAHASDAAKEPVALIGQAEKAPENAQVVPSSGLVAPSSTLVAVESATSSSSVALFDETATDPVAESSASVAVSPPTKTEDDLFDFLNGGVPMTIPTIQEFIGCDAETARKLRQVMRSRGISDRVSLDVVRRAIESKKSRPQSVESASS